MSACIPPGALQCPPPMRGADGAGDPIGANGAEQPSGAGGADQWSRPCTS